MGRFLFAPRILFAFTAAMLAVGLTDCGAGHNLSTIPPTSKSFNRTHLAQTYASGSTSLTITPNFAAGFGPVHFSLQNSNNINGYLSSSPAPGSGAAPSAGYVDFGSVQQGTDYLYRYAVQLQIKSVAGATVYAAASSDLVSSGGTLPIGTHLSWLPTAPSTTSTYGADANDTFRSGSTPFQLDTAGLTNAASLYSGSSQAVTLPYDFILRLGTNDPIGSYSTSIVYTVVSH